MKSAVKFIVCLSLVALMLVSTTGCKKKISRCVVSGTVSTNGEAVPKGTIQFIPENPDPTLQVAGASADIIDGAYTLTPDSGLVEGKYKVCVIALAFRNKKTGELVDPEDMKDGKLDPASVKNEDLVPPGYGVADSEQFVEVTGGKTMTFDLNMVSN